MPNGKNRQIAENLPNLVTLIEADLLESETAECTHHNLFMTQPSLEKNRGKGFSLKFEKN
jgi:hypothetical protein